MDQEEIIPEKLLIAANSVALSVLLGNTKEN
jgi:hypothetical protein